jgi:hypothetical protein
MTARSGKTQESAFEWRQIAKLVCTGCEQFARMKGSRHVGGGRTLRYWRCPKCGKTTKTVE